MKSLFKNHKVIICTGSGGVGKTTVSASLGVLAAQKGYKVLVLTIDPAKRLKTTLGIGDDQDDVLVPDQNFKGKLFAGLVDEKKVFRDFLRNASDNDAIVERVLNNRLYKQLSTTLSGSQEFTSIIRLFEAVKSNKYDIVILDTPPAQHAIDFLTAPEKIYTLFQGPITKWFISEEEVNRNIFLKVVNKSTGIVLAVFRKITGSMFMDELSDFFLGLKTIQGRISEKTKSAGDMLHAQDTAFLLVTSFDQAKIQEAEEYYMDLKKGHYNLQGVVVNRAFPKWFKSQQEQKVWPDLSEESFQKLHAKMTHYYKTQAAVYDQFKNNYGQKIQILKVAEFDEDISGLDELKTFSETLMFEVDDKAFEDENITDLT